MPTDFLIISFIGVISLIFILWGFVERKLPHLTFLGGGGLLVLVGILARDQNVTVAYTSAGAAINYAVTGEIVLFLGIIAVGSMLMAGFKAAHLL